MKTRIEIRDPQDWKDTQALISALQRDVTSDYPKVSHFSWECSAERYVDDAPLHVDIDFRAIR